MRDRATSDRSKNETNQDQETDQVIVEEFVAIITRLKLSDATTATLAGLSPPTIHVARLTKTLPVQRRCRDAIVRFVIENRMARSLRELRIVT